MEAEVVNLEQQKVNEKAEDMFVETVEAEVINAEEHKVDEKAGEIFDKRQGPKYEEKAADVVVEKIEAEVVSMGDKKVDEKADVDTTVGEEQENNKGQKSGSELDVMMGNLLWAMAKYPKNLKLQDECLINLAALKKKQKEEKEERKRWADVASSGDEQDKCRAEEVNNCGQTEGGGEGKQEGCQAGKLSGGQHDGEE